MKKNEYSLFVIKITLPSFKDYKYVNERERHLIYFKCIQIHYNKYMLTRQ